MKEGYLNDSIPTLNEKEFNDFLKNNYEFNFNMFIGSKTKYPSRLTNEEIVNEINAYYEIYKKFISMDEKTCQRVYELNKVLIKREKGAAKWELNNTITIQQLN